MERALARAKRIEEGWCFAELLRKNGELLLVRAAPTDVANAEECFRQALEAGPDPLGAQGVGPRLPAVHRARREVFRVGALEDSVDVAGGATSPPG